MHTNSKVTENANDINKIDDHHLGENNVRRNIKRRVLGSYLFHVEDWNMLHSSIRNSSGCYWPNWCDVQRLNIKHQSS